jgi:hypothetical protein
MFIFVLRYKILFLRLFLHIGNQIFHHSTHFKSPSLFNSFLNPSSIRTKLPKSTEPTDHFKVSPQALLLGLSLDFPAPRCSYCALCSLFCPAKPSKNIHSLLVLPALGNSTFLRRIWTCTQFSCTCIYILKFMSAQQNTNRHLGCIVHAASTV